MILGHLYGDSQKAPLQLYVESHINKSAEIDRSAIDVWVNWNASIYEESSVK